MLFVSTKNPEPPQQIKQASSSRVFVDEDGRCREPASAFEKKKGVADPPRYSGPPNGGNFVG